MDFLNHNLPAAAEAATDGEDLRPTLSYSEDGEAVFAHPNPKRSLALVEESLSRLMPFDKWRRLNPDASAEKVALARQIRAEFEKYRAELREEVANGPTLLRVAETQAKDSIENQDFKSGA